MLKCCRPWGLNSQESCSTAGKKKQWCSCLRHENLHVDGETCKTHTKLLGAKMNIPVQLQQTGVSTPDLFKLSIPTTSLPCRKASYPGWQDSLPLCTGMQPDLCVLQPAYGGRCFRQKVGGRRCGRDTRPVYKTHFSFLPHVVLCPRYTETLTQGSSGGVPTKVQLIVCCFRLSSSSNIKLDSVDWVSLLCGMPHRQKLLKWWTVPAPNCETPFV